MEILHVTIPDWTSLERSLRIKKPFALWRIADIPVFGVWLDLACEADFERVEFHAPASLRLSKALLAQKELWPISWDFVPTPPPASSYLVSSQGGENAWPVTGWDLVDLHWKMTLHRFRVLEKQFLPIMPDVNIGKHSRIHPRAKLIAPYWIGENCLVEADATVGPNASLGDHCVIQRGATLRESHLGSHVSIGRDTVFDGYFIQGGAVLCREQSLQHPRMDPLLVQFLPPASTI